MARLNYKRILTDLNQCSDIEGVKDVLGEIVAALEANGIGAIPRTADEANRTDGGFYEFPTGDPARSIIRFELDDAFSSNVAPAHVVSPITVSALDPNEPIQVVDTFGLFVAGQDGDQGYAMVMPDASGVYQNEIIMMHGVGAPTGTDNFTVKFDSGADTADFFDQKVEGLVAPGTYDSMTDVEVSWELVGTAPGPYTIRAFVGDGITVTALDEKVAVESGDTPGYLRQKVSPVVGAAYNASVHNLVFWNVVELDVSQRVMVGFTQKSTESGRVRVSSGDSLDYLGNQFQDTGAYDEDVDDLSYVDVANGTTVRIHHPKPVAVIKLLSTLSARTGAVPGCIGSSSQNAELVELSGTCGASPEYVSRTPTPAYVTVYNMSLEDVVASSGDPIYVVGLRQAENEYVACTLELHGLNGYDPDETQTIGHCASEENRWHNMTETEVVTQVACVENSIVGTTAAISSWSCE